MQSVKYCNEYANIDDRKTYRDRATANDGDNRPQKSAEQLRGSHGKRAVAMYCLLVGATTAGFAAIFIISFEFQGTWRRDILQLEEKYQRQLMYLEEKFRQLNEKNDNVTLQLRNLTEQMKKKSHVGPKQFYHTSTLSWQISKLFCERDGQSLCAWNQLCFPRNGSYEFIDDVIPGDHYVAVSDSYNEWVGIGDFQGYPCFLHSQRWGRPHWGVNTEVSPYKGYVYCCNRISALESDAPDVRYQYIGRTATYASSAAHCANQGRRLCYSWEACKSNVPVLGLVKGDKWIAVRDEHNEWLQIGEPEGRVCKLHGALHGRPWWGLRDDGSLIEPVGYVYCCKNTDESQRR